MDANSFRPETHVAQQSRRDKLRFQQSLTSVQHLEDFTKNLDQLTVTPELTPDLVQVGHVRNGNMLYDPTLLSSEMLNPSTSSNVLPTQQHAILIDPGLATSELNRPIAPRDSSFTNMSNLVLPNFISSAKASTDVAHGCGNWSKLGSEQSYDLKVTYSGGSVEYGERNNKRMLAGDVLPNNARLAGIYTNTQYSKPSYNDNELQSSLANPSDEFCSQDSQKQFRELQFTSRPPNQSMLQDVVTSGLIGRNNECVLHPSYENQQTALHFNSVNDCMGRPVENSHQWSSEVGPFARKRAQELRTVPSYADTQGLSLSLSSSPPSKVSGMQVGEAHESECLQSKNGFPKGSHHHPKVAKASYLSPMPRPSVLIRNSEKSLHNLLGSSTCILQNTGPLGPFTGYATIVNSSRFLKPAQELLDDFCSVTGMKLIKACDLSKMIGEVSPPALTDGVNTADKGDEGVGDNNSGVSSCTFRRSNEESGHCGVGNSSCESYMPDYQKMKAMLLYLQEEICRRYKQYHQQMQMVASFFESVAGLSAATPYISLAIKTVSGNFRSLKHAISNQLKHVTKTLADNLFSKNTVGSSTTRLRFMDPSYQNNKPGGANAGYLEPQEHIWRPQRGLPERAVVILKAWLFEHFLHPYPTDTDKHMLATQTGLSRNQVSNWFINARVRLWKPMVEEIHTLETKGFLEANQGSGENGGNSAEGASQKDGDHQTAKRLGRNYMLIKEMECSRIGSSLSSADQLDAGQWNTQEKRSRVEFQVPITASDRSLMNSMPYQKTSWIDNGGLGAVSLTLGLRHGVDRNVQHHQQLHRHENQLSRQYGSQMIHDLGE